MFRMFTQKALYHKHNCCHGDIKMSLTASDCGCSSPVSVLQNSGEKEMSSTATRPPLGLLKATSKTTWRGRQTLVNKAARRHVRADACPHTAVKCMHNVSKIWRRSHSQAEPGTFKENEEQWASFREKYKKTKVSQTCPPELVTGYFYSIIIYFTTFMWCL